MDVPLDAPSGVVVDDVMVVVDDVMVVVGVVVLGVVVAVLVEVDVDVLAVVGVEELVVLCEVELGGVVVDLGAAVWVALCEEVEDVVLEPPPLTA